MNYPAKSDPAGNGTDRRVPIDKLTG